MCCNFTLESLYQNSFGHIDPPWWPCERWTAALTMHVRFSALSCSTWRAGSLKIVVLGSAKEKHFFIPRPYHTIVYYILFSWILHLFYCHSFIWGASMLCIYTALLFPTKSTSKPFFASFLSNCMMYTYYATIVVVVNMHLDIRNVWYMQIFGYMVVYTVYCESIFRTWFNKCFWQKKNVTANIRTMLKNIYT